MRITFPTLILLAGLTVRPWHMAFADTTTEAQLRTALQQATNQIATLENQVANLQAAQAPDAAMINTLQAQVQTLKQQAAQPGSAAAEPPAQKVAQDRQDAALRRQMAVQEAELGKTQAAYAQAASSASAKTATNTQLMGQLAALRTQNDSCLAKNSALFKVGNEILDQLAHRSTLWSGFSSVEPFVGIERVKLQNIVQDDQNKLLDNQIDTSGGTGQ